MSEIAKPRVFFLKSYPDDLKTIITYLTKRDVEVESHHDLREGVLNAISYQPTYFFVAWDHPNEKVLSVPKVIAQSCAAMIIPYMMSSDKEQLRKLDSLTNYNHKLYPPVSGPSIMRLISKIQKENEEPSIDQSKRRNSILSNNSNESITVTSKGGTNPDLDQFLSELSSAPATPTKDVSGDYQKELFKQNQAKLKSKPYQNLNEKLKALLQSKFLEEVKSQMQEVALTSVEGKETSVTDISSNNYRKLLCLTIQSESWCGYLLVASQVEINNDDYKTIIQNWLKDKLIDFNDISKNDYFELSLEIHNFSELKNWIEETSGYFETVDVQNNEIVVSFFTLDPKFLIVELNDTHEMLEVSIDLLDVDKQHNFSLFLHLPENKKYILYTLPYQSLLANQKQRLVDKSVSKLYTPIEFEAELKKLKAEKYLNSTYQQMKKEIG